MATMSFVKTEEEVSHFAQTPNWMRNCEGVYAAWATDAAALAAVLPAPLKMVAPVVISYVADIAEPNFCTRYKEAALMTAVMNNGKPGIYTIAMLLEDGDNATFMGRDVLSIPKKNADSIELERSGGRFSAKVSRMGVDLMEFEGKLGEYNDPAMAGKLFGARTPGADVEGINYFFKFAISQDDAGVATFDGIELVNGHTQMVYHSWEPASVDVTLRPSVDDPWASLPCLKPLGAAWTRFDLGLLGVVATEKVENASEVISKNLAQRFDSPVFG